MKHFLAALVALLLIACETPSEPLPSVYERSLDVVVSLEFKQDALGADLHGGPRAFCSGVVLAADKIITNRHCAEAALPARQIWVRFHNGRFVKATFVGRADLPVDAAVLRIEPVAGTVVAVVRTTP